jgi:Flp pilus assembly protein TadB
LTLRLRDHMEVAPATCLHGLEPDSCLICQTLATKPASPAKTDRPRRAGRAPRSLPVLGPDDRAPDRPARRFSVAGALALLLASVIVVWVVVAALWTTFRVLELALVAAAAGWLGWRLGVWHGRRLGR